MRAELEVSRKLLDSLLCEAAAAYPDECCGILFGSANRIASHRPGANVHPTPETHFEIDPQALIEAHRAAREGGPQVAGYYHSHPASPPVPSATDQARAAGGGSIWAIVGEGRVTFWRDDPGCFKALSYAVFDE